jgi:pyruvate/2-oxoglutarate dehydrogenase complex dihydrolipoamide acyltransferase (E2) component
MSHPANDHYELQPFPRSRRLVLDAGWNARRRHMMHGLLEVDVSVPRERIRQHAERTGERLSFTAFIAACLGQAVDDDRTVHAYRDWRGRLVVFDEVDATLAIEVEIDGHKIPMMHILRGINQRSCFDLHQEIRSIQSRPERSEGMGFIRYFPYLPTFLRRLIYRIVERNPRWMKRAGGTVGLTSVGMFGTHSGWGIGMPVHSLAVMVGGIAQKPGVVDGRIEAREYMDLTISFDHNIVDGAPAARFAQKFIELIECGYGLDEQKWMPD